MVREIRKCKVCGRSVENGQHVECRDPVVSLSLNATDWIKLVDNMAHYFKIMDAVDHGGSHGVDKVKFTAVAARLTDLIREAVNHEKS